jgi:predicted transcriptional regulator of viral defense system
MKKNEPEFPENNPPRAYIGGWTAANHWGLIDDLTICTFVFAADMPAAADLAGAEVDVTIIRPHMFYGITAVDGAPMSDIHKTLIDAFLHPDFFGGADVLDGMVENYFLHPDNDVEILKRYSLMARNAVLAKKISTLADMK